MQTCRKVKCIICNQKLSSEVNRYFSRVSYGRTHLDRQTCRQKGKHIETDRHADRQENTLRQTERQTVRHTNRQKQ